MHTVKPIEFLLDNAHSILVTYNSTKKENFNTVKKLIENSIDDSYRKKSNFGIIGTHKDLKTNKPDESDFNNVKTFCMTNNINI